MHSSLKPIKTNPNTHQIQTFEGLCYPFKNIPQINQSLFKTSIELDNSQAIQQISILTRLSHKNIINLKKIGKSKKYSSKKTHLYWLYYQNIPYTIQNTSININSTKLKDSLKLIFEYLQYQKIGVKLRKENIGISSEDQIKVYIPASDIIISSNKNISPTKYAQQMQELVNWFQKKIKKKQITDKKPQQKKTKNIRLQNIDKKLEDIRKKIRSVQFKYQLDSISCNPSKQQHQQLSPNKIYQLCQVKQKDQEKNAKLQKIQQNINCINIFHNTNQILNPNNLYCKDVDNQSIDTYQMQMGQDHQMPSIKTNQRLRQTIFTDKKPWDSMTTRTNSKNTKHIYQSAGNKLFNKIIENNKVKLENDNQNNSDSQTINQKSKKRNNNWPIQTFRSDEPPNIQQRVQEALVKTKNIMSKLKSNTKSFSLQKF